MIGGDEITTHSNMGEEIVGGGQLKEAEGEVGEPNLEEDLQRLGASSNLDQDLEHDQLEDEMGIYGTEEVDEFGL